MLQDEKILYRAKPHWVWLARPALVVLVGFSCSLCSIIGAVGPSSPGQPPLPDGLIGTMVTVSGCILGLGLLATVVAALGYINADFRLTNRRVIREGGILARRSKEIFLNKVESVDVETPLLGRLLGYGTVVITGSGGAREPLVRVGNPQEIRERIQREVARF